MTSVPTRKEAGVPPTEPAEADVYVIGDGRVGAAVARRLREEGDEVVLLDRSIDAPDVPGRALDPTDVSALDEAGLDSASTVVVATPSDGQNLLVAQLVRVRFDVDRLIVLVNDPDRVGVLADAGHEPLCATTILADALVEEL